MKKKGEKITMVTAYDYHSARVVDAAGIDVILVGDSLGMVIQGHENTLPVTVQDVTYQVSTAEAVANAGRLIKEGRAQAVKIEGGREFLNTVGALTDASIPVMGHLGLTPQSVHRFGGFRVQGRTEDSRKRILEDAGLLERAGCFSLVLEGIPHEIAGEITGSLAIPTIGIGAGPECDGQVLVFHDLLGIEAHLEPKFVKRYANLNDEMIDAIGRFRREVKEGAFPDLDHSYSSSDRRAPRAGRRPN
jgi:3-methyl-2-oxobutanoate hydroxymethyltransferase